MVTDRHIFESADLLAERLAIDVAANLRLAISANGHATLAVSGGTTPQKFFVALSRQNLDWSHVTITLVDERQVDESSPRSNARLVKANLLQGAASMAKFVSLFANPAAANVPDFDVVILGMGADGHTASFFPGGDALELALSEAAPPIVAISAPGSGEARLTFSLPKVLAAGQIFLHIQGADKWATLLQAEAGGKVMEMPVRAVLQSGRPVEIFWCP